MPSERQLRNEQAMATLEDRQVTMATRQLRARLAAAFAHLRTVPASKLQEEVTATLRAVGADPGVTEHLVIAMELGFGVGRRQITGQPLGAAPATPDSTLADVVYHANDRVRQRLDQAAALAGQLPMTSDADLGAVLQAAERAANGAETDAAWVVHRSATLGKHVAADERGWNLVWVTERNACLNCLAYAGRVIAPRGVFPGGLTYGDHPLQPYGPLVGPPLHPHCRCQLDRTNLQPGTLDIGLAREAARSVARGLTDYASNPARFRAVQRLVNGQLALPDAALVQLPRSVMDRARRNLAAGQFRFRPDSPQAQRVIAQRARDRARTRTAGRP